MVVWAYTIVRNEERMLPWWIRHYRTFCERLVVYDDWSDDETIAVAVEGGAQVRPLPYTGLDDGLQAEFSSQMYREARGRADFVVVVDADELLVGPIDSGWSLPYVQGYQMFAEAFPEDDGRQLYEHCPIGMPYEYECKPCLFRPELDIRFNVGRHTCNLRPVNWATGLKLLHYRWFGRDYAIERSARNYARLPERAFKQPWPWGHNTYPGEREGWADDLEARAAREADEVLYG